MNKQTEALKLALDCVSTLANARDWVGCTPNERWDEDEMYEELCNATICLKKSLSIIQEALAEQPAQQGPVAWMWKDGTITSDPDRADGTWMPLYTTPPASKPWVGLTEQEHTDIAIQCGCMSADWVFYGATVERILKEKNS